MRFVGGTVTVTATAECDEFLKEVTT